MLSWMRKRAGTWMVKFIFGIIIIVFCTWGVGSYTQKKFTRVALVNGEPVPIKNYEQVYNFFLDNIRKRFGSNLNENILKSFNIKQMALNQVINNSLLIQESRRLGFRVTDAELSESIKSIPSFRRNGFFDLNLYKTILDSNRIAPEEFETSQRQALLINKLRMFTTGAVSVSDDELKQWIEWNDCEARIDYLLFNPDNYKNVEASEKEIKDYFEKNKENYKTEPMLKAEYIRFNPDDYVSDIKVSDAELKDFYDSHKQEFISEKTVEARHILIKVKNESDETEVNSAKKRILAISEKIKKGADFAKTAEKYSEGPSGKNGGYLGKFDRKAMVKPFADKAFSMKQGEVSDPVRTSFGWHIIKVEKVNPEVVKTFGNVKQEIKEKIIEQKARGAAYDEAESVYETAFETGELKQTAEERKLEIKTTEFFSKRGPEKGFANGFKFASACFSLKLNEISEILDLGDGYYLTAPIEKLDAKIPQIAKVKEKVLSDLLKEKRKQKAKDEAEKLFAQIKEGKKTKKNFSAAGFFKRNDSIPGLGFEKEILEEAFKLSDKKPFPEKILSGRKGYYIIRFKEKKLPDAKQIEKKKQEIKTTLLEQKKEAVFNALLENLRNKGEIEIEERFL